MPSKNKCDLTMQIKFIKDYPTAIGWRKKGGSGKYNIKATLKAMNLIMQGYADLIHSCKECNPLHLDINLKDFKERKLNEEKL